MMVRVVLLTSKGHHMAVVKSQEFESEAEATVWAGTQMSEGTGEVAHLFECESKQSPSGYLIEIIRK